jgi:hypothetical protein
MVVAETRFDCRVTSASATSVQLEPTADTWDRASFGQLSTITLSGTQLRGFAVGD